MNDLPTPAEAERLMMLMEECAEVIQAASKILRHGWTSFNPHDVHRVPNSEHLDKELLDLKAVVWAMQQQDKYVAGEPGYSELDATWEKKLRYTHHQGEAA